jgi:ABC-type polysaccharide/polyol phosphate transport system ATPase subunit
MTQNTTKIEVVDIGKTVRGDFIRGQGMLSRILLALSRKRNKKEVLKNISFTANTGEIVGIIGRNGSGKSTLLRIIADIYFPTTGKVHTHGQITYITSLGLGLVTRLTTKENIFLTGAIMGMSRKDIRKILPDIIEFSGLSEHIDSKILHFSTGMIARLSFAVTFFCLKHTNSEILLLDEVFGSGADIDFEKKAITKMEELIQSGVTVIMVSHNLDIMQKYCHKIIWLDKGEIKAIGKPDDIIGKYKI